MIDDDLLHACFNVEISLHSLCSFSLGNQSRNPASLKAYMKKVCEKITCIGAKWQ